MGKIKAVDVFTPGSFPKHTYVSRENDDVERRLRFALETRGQVVSLAGPSKSGKTVLVEKVVGFDNLITITGAGIGDPDVIWDRTLAWMGTPTLGIDCGASRCAKEPGVCLLDCAETSTGVGEVQASAKVEASAGLARTTSSEAWFPSSGGPLRTTVVFAVAGCRG